MDKLFTEAASSTKFVDDKKLRLDIAQIQESVREENIEIKWVKTHDMLADSLTKNGVNSSNLLQVLSSGRFEEEKKEKIEWEVPRLGQERNEKHRKEKIVLVLICDILWFQI